MLESVWRDLRHGVRVVAKNPGFSLIAVITMALGIGANSAIFGLVNAVLLRPLPVEQPKDLFFVSYAGSQSSGGAPPYPCLEELRNQTTHLSKMAGFSLTSLKAIIDGEVEELSGQFASGNYFSLLGLRTIVGSPFTPLDDSVAGQGGPNGPVAVVGYNFWRRRFASDPSVIGKVIDVGLQCSQCGGDFQKTPVTIIGVAPPGFTGLAPGHDIDIHLPIALMGAKRLADPRGFWLLAVARLKKGSSVEQARAELDPTFKAFVDKIQVPPQVRTQYLDHIALTPANRGLRTLRGPFTEPTGLAGDSSKDSARSPG